MARPYLCEVYIVLAPISLHKIDLHGFWFTKIFVEQTLPKYRGCLLLLSATHPQYNLNIHVYR